MSLCCPLLNAGLAPWDAQCGGGGKKLGRKARLVRIKRKGKGREGVKGSSGEAWRGRACAGRQAGRRWGPAPL